MPSTDQLEHAHKALQVLFMGLALIGLLVILPTIGFGGIARGAARKHALGGST